MPNQDGGYTDFIHKLSTFWPVYPQSNALFHIVLALYCKKDLFLTETGLIILLL